MNGRRKNGVGWRRSIFHKNGPYLGTVTERGSGNPVPGVLVSDGRNVVKTDENGAFLLKGYRKTRFIILTTPAGYTTEQYFLPVEQGVDSYSFYLIKSDRAAAKEHCFLQVSDTEIGAQGAGDWLKHVKQLVKTLQPAFLIHTGDICYEAGLKRHFTDMNTQNMEVPVRYVIGNHDYVAGPYGEALFERIYGPVWYSFEVGCVHYVVTPFQQGADRRSGYHKNDRWRWLENDLANTDPDMQVVMLHHTLPPSENFVLRFGRKRLDLKKHRLLAWVFGHYHYNYVYEQSGVICISTARPDCGGIDSSASGTRKITIHEDGTLTTKMYYYHAPEVYAPPSQSIWSIQLQGNILFPDTLLSGSRVYIATADDDWPHHCGIYCLDADTGAVKWHHPIQNSVKNNLLIVDQNVIAQDCQGHILCLRAADGEERWSAQAKFHYSLGTSSGICSDETTLFAGSSASVTAFRLRDGKMLWSYHRRQGESSPAEFLLAGERLIISPHWDALAALDVHTGKLLWQNRDSGIRFRSSTPVLIDEKTLLVADADSVMLVDLQNGKINSKTKYEGYQFSSSGQPVIHDGVAYIPTATHGLIAWEIASKTIRWNWRPGAAMVYTAPYTSGQDATVESTPVLQDGELIVGASDGILYRLRAADGAMLSRTAIGAPILGKAAPCNDGTVVVSDFAGRVTKVML